MTKKIILIIKKYKNNISQRDGANIGTMYGDIRMKLTLFFTLL